MKLSNKTWQLLIGKEDGPNNSRNVFVLKQHYPKWQSLKQDHVGNYYLTSILRAIYSLNALAGGRSPLTKPLKLEGAEIHYQIDADGDILIHGLAIDSNIRPCSHNQATGLYQVRLNREAWHTQEETKTAMELPHRWNNAHYAAVGGRFDDKEQAGQKLINHISEAYKAAVSPSEINRNKNHYSLYWQQNNYNSNTNVEAVTSLIQQAQAQKANVNWLVHGEGAGTFVQALKTISTYPSLSRFEANDGEIVRNLRNITSQQKVFFSNPRGKDTSTSELKAWSEKAGLTYVDTNINPYDLYNPDARHNALKKSGVLASKGVIGGGIGILGIGNSLKSWDLALSGSTTLAIGGFLLAGYFVSRDSASTLSGYVRSLPAAWKSSRGKGNQDWVA